MLQPGTHPLTPPVALTPDRAPASKRPAAQRSTADQPTSAYQSRVNQSGSLYRPDFEHDACGVGFIAHIKGEKRHQIVSDGLTILEKLAHRGACGCDQDSGDGAGILMQLPDAFCRDEAAKQGLELPSIGRYAVGILFLPPQPELREQAEREFERIVRAEGQKVLGWRDVPVNSNAIGQVARSTEPAMRHVFVGRSDSVDDAMGFERKLYVIRRLIEKWADTQPAIAKYFAVPSLSYRTLAYKGMLRADQLRTYFRDLSDERLTTALAIVHSRYSTNTFPEWPLAHPFRYIAHNGEINTKLGNLNWMRTRESMMQSPLFGEDLAKLFPICKPELSDSAVLDQALELLVLAGRSLPHAIMMMVPEAYESQKDIDPNKRAFYQYSSCLMEPWDGPASITFTDGTLIGATLDRNGLRPSRYIVTDDDMVILSSEVGVLAIPTNKIRLKARLQPGKMLLVDTGVGRIISDEELKADIVRQKPYSDWIDVHHLSMDDLQEAEGTPGTHFSSLLRRQQAFGYTQEDLNRILLPMAQEAQEPVGSMGTDTPLAVLSDRSQLLFNYFKQLFAQVTNPPIDPIRENVVMSNQTLLGSEGNLLDETPQQAALIRLKSPILTNEELQRIRQNRMRGFRSKTINCIFKREDGEAGLAEAMHLIRQEASDAVNEGCTMLILSDRTLDEQCVPVPSLLALSGVHHHLIRQGQRTRCALIVETGEAREVQHFALLIGYGANAVNPYLVYETYAGMDRDGLLQDKAGDPMDLDKAMANFIKAVDKGLLKIYSKMGISTLLSYRGAQIFEAIGIDAGVIDEYFAGTPSRIGGIGLDIIAREALRRHDVAYPQEEVKETPELEIGGEYMWRRRGEYHMWNPDTIQRLQHAVNRNALEGYREFSRLAYDNSRALCTLRGLLKLKPALKPVHPDDVEPAKEIVKRFCTGAMSFGSISAEAHETLAIAMNRLGGRSNTGEGGEDPARFIPLLNGDSKNSAIKQVASGRFGVTANYLANAIELQIKMAQGAKPGEGGQLPGPKVDENIAKTRYSTPGVGLISPPPHHDVYSIEDLAQLIFDLKNSNPAAEVSVKLVAEVGVGTIAAGVAKGYADRILISGDSGGTGASPISSIKHAGIPWELGLAETQQTLVRNGLRGRVRLQADGSFKTGRDVVIAACLGAEEFGFSTAPLIAIGCIMMRKCHLNTCPVGIATQDPVLRKRFTGTPEQVVNYMFFVAEEVRELLAGMGYTRLDEIIGRSDLLEVDDLSGHWKAKTLDLAPILAIPQAPPGMSNALRCVDQQANILDEQMDWHIVGLCKQAIQHETPVEIKLPISNANRTVGTILSYHVSKRLGESGLPEDTISIEFTGSAGQSFGAFLTRGITLRVVGDANDYCGKGLSGGKIIVSPPKDAAYTPEKNIVIGNVALYGATGGHAYFRGIAGERFCVRNSGARAVVEGVGDHGCEYMTGGVVVVLGKTGRNFAAGMSGGYAFVLDVDGKFRKRCNTEMVDLMPVEEDSDISLLHSLISNHVLYTDSTIGENLMDHWHTRVEQFVKVFPKDYRRVLAAKAEIQRSWELGNR